MDLRILGILIVIMLVIIVVLAIMLKKALYKGYDENRFEEMVIRQIQAEGIRSEQNLQNMRETLSVSLRDMSIDNRRQLEKMMQAVGDIQMLASGIGDLKKVFTNVKTRGILGEVQLGAIIREMLSPEQYEENIRTKKSGNERVEFAVKMPGGGGGTCFLPIDAKFPGDRYEQLLDAYDSGDATAVEGAKKRLVRELKREAKDISEKYIEPPYTTDFGVMFLPAEGLYAEAVKLGMIEILQKEYRISLAGPSTMAALLNSLQMGFRTIAIEQKTGEVWRTLANVKTEFGKYTELLEKTGKHINMAAKDIDELLGVRARQMERALSDITETDIKNTKVRPESDRRDSEYGMRSSGENEESGPEIIFETLERR